MARINMHPSGKSIKCEGGVTELLALERAGYALPKNCRAGASSELIHTEGFFCTTRNQ